MRHPHAPLGAVCTHCGEPFGLSAPYYIEVNGRELHYECLLRRLLGSVKHQGRGGCAGECYDDPALTRRQAAQAAVEEFNHSDSCGTPGYMCLTRNLHLHHQTLSAQEIEAIYDSKQELRDYREFGEKNGYLKFALVPGIPGTITEFPAQGPQFSHIPRPPSDPRNSAAQTPSLE